MTDTVKTLHTFKGLNNVADVMRTSTDAREAMEEWKWQTVADNVDFTDENTLVRRSGYISHAAATQITASYATIDQQRLYIIDNGSLKRVHSNGDLTVLATGVVGAMHWTELNGTVYLSNSSLKLQISISDIVSEWGIPTPVQVNTSAVTGSLPAGTYQVLITYVDEEGREGGASTHSEITLPVNSGISVTSIGHTNGLQANLYMTDSDGTVYYLVETLPTAVDYTISYPAFGRELTTQFLDPPPVAGTDIATFMAKLYVGTYDPVTNVTTIWSSLPLAPHLFNLNEGYISIPDRLVQMFGADGTLLLSTDKKIYVYDGEKIAQVAEYGGVEGQHTDTSPDGKTYFWTTRGLCRISPFENVTEERVSFPPGTYAGGAVVDENGFRKYVILTHQGGDAYNRRITNDS